MADYKFIIVPLDHFSNEIITAELAAICALSGNEVIFRFKKATKRGYYVEHEFLTKLKRNKDSRIRFERYKQRGNGPIKPYDIPEGRAPQHLKNAKKRLKEITSKK